jgi:uncharacterized protein YjiS (DUF1127 family)
MHTISAQAVRSPLRARSIPSISLTELALRAVTFFQLWRERAQGRRQLVKLDDHLLRDIGVSRYDAEMEFNKPFWQA